MGIFSKCWGLIKWSMSSHIFQGCLSILRANMVSLSLFGKKNMMFPSLFVAESFLFVAYFLFLWMGRINLCRAHNLVRSKDSEHCHGRLFDAKRLAGCNFHPIHAWWILGFPPDFLPGRNTHYTHYTNAKEHEDREIECNEYISKTETRLEAEKSLGRI